MKTLFEVLKVILPAVIAGLSTFLITKYSYNKNRPLNKLEIAYNRIYYPIYRIISNKNISQNINEVINKSSIYITKYDKYADVSTKRLFKVLCSCNKEAKKKTIYNSFKNNIYNKNSYLRRRLGYLEPNFVQLYKYATPGSKSLFRIFMELCVIYIALIVCSITMNISKTIFVFFATILAIFLLGIICELIWCFLRFLYYTIRK